jgi:hypothetical protein
MLSSKAVQTQFAIVILCPTASYSDLLQEARNRHVLILEMIPFSEDFDAYERHITAGTAILFVYGAGKSELACNKESLSAALDICRCHNTPVTAP